MDVLLASLESLVQRGLVVIVERHERTGILGKDVSETDALQCQVKRQRELDQIRLDGSQQCPSPGRASIESWRRRPL